MGLLIIFGFILWCALAIFVTGFASPLLILFFPLKQLIQSSSDFFRDTELGNASANYSVALITALATGYAVFRNQQRVQGILNGTTIIIATLYIWALFSCLWSPGASQGFGVFVSAAPYFLMFLIFLPLLITNLNEWDNASRLCLVMGTIMSGLILISPEFTMRYGRLGLDVSSFIKGGRSSPLALGELGGTCIVLAVFVGTKFDPLYFKVLRCLAIIAGTILAVRSGSRGQLLFAVVAIALAYPIGKSLVSTKNSIFTAISLVLTLVLIYYIIGLVISTGSIDTEKRWAEGATNEGLDARYNNIIFLLDTWSRSPGFWIQGLGYYSFSALTPFGEPYSHAIVVDMLCELGIIGFLLFFAMFIFLWLSCRKIFIAVRDHPIQRAKFGSLAALLIYQILLSNKQGNFAGAFLMFGLILLVSRIEKSSNFYSEIISEESSDFPE